MAGGTPALPCPYETGEEFEAALRAAGSQRALSFQLGVHRDVITRWANYLGVPASLPAKTVHPASPPTAADGPDDGWIFPTLKALGDDATVEQLADHADTSPRRVREALERLGNLGYRIAADADRVTLERVPPAPSHEIHRAVFDGERIRFAIVSDTHLGSKECRLGELRTAYQMIEAEGITTVYHPGDLVAGSGIYRHQARSLYAHTFEEQVEHAVEAYPRADGVTTYIIGGNHDLEGDFGKMAADPVRAVCNQRDDIVHCGSYSAWFELANGAHMHMLHPGGGSSYALSYKAQKLAEAYEAGRKPALLLLGHYHRRGVFRHREIEVMLCGAFEGSTDLSRRFGLGPANVGFHIVEATLADDGSLVRMRFEWMPFFVGRHAVAA